MTKTIADYKKHLQQQLHYIRHSADLYDQGHHDEAARIAVSLRVLLHDTRNSTSLLTHLGEKNNIKLASKTSDDTAILAQPGIKGFLKISMVTIGIGQCMPDLTPANRFVDVPTWLNECIIAVPPNQFSRNQVILWVANRDGGAHVDSTVPPEYEWLKDDGAIGSLEFDGELKDIPDAPYTILRTMASEILESPDLLGLLT